MSNKHRPKGPNSTWKTGQRVPATGRWVDQNGTPTWHQKGDTFPPTAGSGWCTGGEVAFRRLAEAAGTAEANTI
jgi:hypothetical protein